MHFKGRTYPQRAIFIAQHAPTLAPAAYEKAIEQLKAGKDVATYTQALSAYNALPNVTQKPQDQSWLDTTLATNSKDRERLEADLKTYTSNMIKESVRVGFIPGNSEGERELNETLLDEPQGIGQVLLLGGRLQCRPAEPYEVPRILYDSQSRH